MAVVELRLDEVRARAIRYRFRIINGTMKDVAKDYLVFTYINNEGGELRAVPCLEELVNA